MRLILIFITICCLAVTEYAQKKPTKKPVKPITETPATVIYVNVKFKNGNEVYGRLINISNERISIDPVNIDSVVISNLMDVAEIRLGEKPKVDAVFLNEIEAACNALTSLATATGGNISYTEYQQKLANTKQVVDVVLERFNTPEYRDNPIILSLKRAIKGFEAVKPIWSLRVGAEQHKYVFESSSVMQTVFEHYPEIRQVDWRQNDRWLIERIIPWLWVQATAQVDAARLQFNRLK